MTDGSESKNASIVTRSISIKNLADCSAAIALEVARIDFSEWPKENVAAGLSSLQAVFGHIYDPERRARNEVPVTFVVIECTTSTREPKEQQRDDVDEKQKQHDDDDAAAAADDDDNDVEQAEENAQLETVVLGTVRIAIEDLPGYDDEFFPWLVSLYVTKDARGRGLARMLVEHALQERKNVVFPKRAKKEETAVNIYLWCPVGESPFLERFYKSCGFETVKLLDDCSGSSHGSKIAIMKSNNL